MWFNRESHRTTPRAKSLGIVIAGLVAVAPVTVLGISVVSLAVASVSVSPTSLNVGQSATGTVALSSIVRITTPVTLSAVPAGVVAVPGSVNVPPLNSRANFAISASSPGCAVVRATQASTTKLAHVYVNSASPQVTLTTDKFSSMLPATFRATVRISLPRGTTSLRGYTVALSSDRPSAVTMPRSVTVPLGQTSTSFDIKAAGYGCIVVTASYGGGSSGKALFVYPEG
jgi:hypothetical protein